MGKDAKEANGNLENFKICPLVHRPLTECYCLDMTSRNIDKVLRYCSGDYEQCVIYMKSRT